MISAHTWTLTRHSLLRAQSSIFCCVHRVFGINVRWKTFKPLSTDSPVSHTPTEVWNKCLFCVCHSVDYLPSALLLCAGRLRPAATTWPNRATRWQRGWRRWTETSSGSWRRWSATTTPPTSESQCEILQLTVRCSHTDVMILLLSLQVWSGRHRRRRKRVSARSDSPSQVFSMISTCIISSSPHFQV